MRRLLNMARPALAEMKTNGYGEKFGEAANPTEVQAFRDNTCRLAALDKALAEQKAAYAELAARGESKSPGVRELVEALRENDAEARELRTLVAAQKSIAGFWIPPRAVYTRKLAEVRALEGRLQQLSEATNGPPGGGDIGEVAAHAPMPRGEQPHAEECL